VRTTPTTSKPTVVAPKGDNASAMKKEGSSSRAGMTTLFLAGVVVGLFVGWAWSAMRSSEGYRCNKYPRLRAEEQNGQNTNTQTPVKITNVNTNASGLTLPLHKSAGEAVAIANVAVSAPTWVTFMNQLMVQPGRALGAQLFFPGTNEWHQLSLFANTARYNLPRWRARRRRR
jgi:hypothetical protein